MRKFDTISSTGIPVAEIQNHTAPTSAGNTLFLVKFNNKPACILRTHHENRDLSKSKIGFAVKRHITWNVLAWLALIIMPVVFAPIAVVQAETEQTEKAPTEEELRYEEAMEAARLRDFSEALLSWRKLADQNNKQAQYRLGAMYRRGLGVKPNLELAAQWFKKAAENGHARAQYNLGVLYQKGLGVKKNPIAAERWFHKAKANGLNLAGLKLKGIVNGSLTNIDIETLTGSARKQPLDINEIMTWAVQEGYANGLRDLFKLGATVDFMDKYGRTPLMIAAQHGQAESAEMLLAHGAKPNDKDKSGSFPLYEAALNKQLTTVKTLLAGGADPNLSTPSKRTALMAAAAKNHTKVIDMLLEHNADIDQRQSDGRTALQIAAAYNNAEAATMLIKHGANTTLVDKAGISGKSVV